VPRVAGLAASGLVALLIGAVVTNGIVLGTSPALPLLFAGTAASIAVARRREVIHLARYVK
jgi:putative oxidoreductase